MTIGDVISSVRDRVLDKTEPYLWSDAELVYYANEAIEEMCREGRMIQDKTTPAICTITLNPGQRDYKLDDRIWTVEDFPILYYGIGNPVMLPKVNVSTLNDNYSGYVSQTGRPLVHACDFPSGYLSIFPLPDIACSLHLTVYRYPLSELSNMTLDIVPEINQRYHKDLVYGILARASAKQNIDTFNQTALTMFTQEWLKCLDKIKKERIDAQSFKQFNTMKPGLF